MKKRQIFFRLAPYNRLSFPVLLNAWEKQGLDREFEIVLREKPFTEPPFPTLHRDDVVLFSFMTPDLPLVHQEIEAVKPSGAIIAGGGPHISGDRELAFLTGFDVIFTGPAETSFPRFGRDLLENSVKRGSVYEPAGDTPLLDQCLPVSKYIKGIPPLEIMRGCYWRCAYCTTGLSSVDFRGLDSIRQYLDYSKERGFKRVSYICPSSMEYGASRGRRLNLEAIEEVLQLTGTYNFSFVEFGIFPSEIRPDTVTDAGMALLKKYVSHKAVTLGAQSGCNHRLKNLRRAHGVEDIEKATEICNANGFLVNLDFIVGYPDETPRERSMTLEFIKKMNKNYRIRVHVHHFIPLSGSTYALRKPSTLREDEKETLVNFKKGGLANAGWIENEIQAQRYFQWLKTAFPRYYSRYE